MAKEDILNRIRTAHQSGQDIVFPMSTMPSDISIEDIANEVKTLTGRDIRVQLAKAKQGGANLRLPFSKEAATPMGESRATGIREQYPSEKYFGAATEGVAQGIAGLASRAAGSAMGSAISGAVGGGLEIGRQMTQVVAGEPGAPTTFSESGGRIAKEVAKGAGIEAVSRGLFGVAGKAFEPPKLSAAQMEIKSLAEKYGVPMTPADIKGTKLSSLLESISEKSLVAGNIIDKFRKGQIKAFNDALTDFVAKMGGKVDRETAGKEAIEIFNARAALSKQKTNALYDEARKTISGGFDQFVQNDNLMKVAQSMLEEEKYFGPELKSKAAPIIKDIVDNRTNFTTLDGFNALRSRLNDLIAAEKSAAKIPGRLTPDGRKYAILLKEAEKDMDSYYSNVNPEAKGLYELAKAAYKEEYSRFGGKEVRYVVSKAPEKVVDAIIKPNNVTAIRKMKSALGDSGFMPIKKRFLQDIAEQAFTAEGGATPMFRSQGMVNALNKYEPETLMAIFNPAELREMGEIAKLGSAMQTAERVAGNASGTARTLSGYGTLTGLGAGVFNSAVAAATLVGASVPVVIAEVITSPAGRKMLLEGATIKPGTAEAAKFATRFTNFAVARMMQSKTNKEK